MQDAFTLQTNFNSIKVQLKHTELKIFLINALFQFHKGTIKAEQGIPPAVSRSISIP